MASFNNRISIKIRGITMKHILKPIRLALLSLGALSFLTACGDSGGETTPPEPPPPVANAAPTVTVAGKTTEEKLAVSLNASASDSDGSIASYAWTQTAGASVTLSGNNSADLSFTAPIAKAEEVLSFVVTVTDNGGATATDSVDVTVTPVNEIQFAMEGLVTTGGESGIASIVKASFAGQTMESTVSDLGAYRFEFDVDEDFGTELVQLEAVSLANSAVNFANIPVSLNNLLALAGEDAVLNAEDDLSVNITQLSSAFSGIISNRALQPLTEASIEDALASIAGNEVLNVAAAVKILSENTPAPSLKSQSRPPELGLPVGYADILDFIRDNDPLVNYITNVQTQAPDVFQVAYQQTVNSADIVEYEPPTVESIDYPIIFRPNILSATGRVNVPQYILDENGNGGVANLFYGSGEQDITWSVDAEGAYLITPLSGDVIVQGAEYFVDADLDGDGINTQERVADVIKSVTINPVSELDNGLLSNVAVTQEQIYLDAGGVNDTSFNGYFTLVQKKNYREINLDDLFGAANETQVLLPFVIEELDFRELPETEFFNDRYNSDSSEIFNLTRSSADATSGAVTTTFLTEFFDNGFWELTEDKKTMFIDFDGQSNAVQVLMDIQQFGDNEVNVVTFKGENSDLIDNVVNGVAATVNPASFPVSDEEVVGVYSLPLSLDFPELTYFWLELKADGTSEVVSVADADGDGVLEQDEHFTFFGDWEREAERILVRRYYDWSIENACKPADGAPTCILNNLREIYLADIIDNRVYTRHNNIFYGFANAEQTAAEFRLQENTARFYEISTETPIDLANLPPQDEVTPQANSKVKAKMKKLAENFFNNTK